MLTIICTIVLAIDLAIILSNQKEIKRNQYRIIQDITILSRDIYEISKYYKRSKQ